MICLHPSSYVNQLLFSLLSRTALQKILYDSDIYFVERMGAYLSFNRGGRDETGDSASQNAYRYPPKTGKKILVLFVTAKTIDLYLNRRQTLLIELEYSSLKSILEKYFVCEVILPHILIGKVTNYRQLVGTLE